MIKKFVNRDNIKNYLETYIAGFYIIADTENIE